MTLPPFPSTRARSTPSREPEDDPEEFPPPPSESFVEFSPKVKPKKLSEDELEKPQIEISKVIKKFIL